MSTADPLAPLRPHLANTLPAVSVPWVAGVLGDHPSQYSLSPAMWNAAFAALRVPAAYVPFDVLPEHIEAFVAAARSAPSLLGFSVTVPYKERVRALLGPHGRDVDAVGAVNTAIRTAEGLVGANTESAAVRAVLERLVSPLPARSSRGILLLGAGGAARAVALAAAQAVPGAAVVVSNRNSGRAQAMADRVNQTGSRARVERPEDLEGLLPDMDIVVNATSVGMIGAIQTDQGVTWLEPFSPLARANPPVLPPRAAAERQPPAGWWDEAWPGIARNLEVSLQRALRLRPDAPVLDLIYAPLETVLLKHARWTGHTAVNGLEVLVGQAVEAFMRICQPLFLEGEAGVREQAAQAMTGALR